LRVHLDGDVTTGLSELAAAFERAVS
jgi:hypothetical protein